mmetsp:Transcript_30007/g.64001  ORF Transcript_30007/g.64001 Transcript_30007/m.64001 type:complete len:240 (-) Transcript_30007:2139-2858(-)
MPSAAAGSQQQGILREGVPHAPDRGVLAQAHGPGPGRHARRGGARRGGGRRRRGGLGAAAAAGGVKAGRPPAGLHRRGEQVRAGVHGPGRREHLLRAGPGQRQAGQGPRERARQGRPARLPPPAAVRRSRGQERGDLLCGYGRAFALGDDGVPEHGGAAPGRGGLHPALGHRDGDRAHRRHQLGGREGRPGQGRPFADAARFPEQRARVPGDHLDHPNGGEPAHRGEARGDRATRLSWR